LTRDADVRLIFCISLVLRETRDKFILRHRIIAICRTTIRRVSLVLRSVISLSLPLSLSLSLSLSLLLHLYLTFSYSRPNQIEFAVRSKASVGRMNPWTTSRRLCALPRLLTRRRRKFQRNAKDQSGCSAAVRVHLDARARARRIQHLARSLSFFLSPLATAASMLACTLARAPPRVLVGEAALFMLSARVGYEHAIFPSPLHLAPYCVAPLLLRNSASCLGAR